MDMNRSSVELESKMMDKIEYPTAPTPANLRNWESAQAAFDKFKAQIEGGESSDGHSTLADVLDYLKETGWKVTRTSLYRHQAEGKILPAADGMYRQKDIDKYARTWLKQQSTGKKISERTDDLQRRKLDLEIKNLEIEQRRKQLSLDKEQERYIPREQMELELAARAGVLEAGLKHWVQSRAAEWIRAVAGDMKKVGDLINMLNHDLDEHINSYASQVEYQVVIDAELEEGEIEPLES